MGARGDIISSGIPGLTSRAHRSPHKLALNSVCRLAPAPRQTISSILLFSSLGSSASSAGWKQICSTWAKMWLWKSGCHSPSVTGSAAVGSQRARLCPQQPKPGEQLLAVWRFPVWRFHQRRKMAHKVVLSTK